MRNKGFTLIEIITYIGLLALIGLIMATFITQTAKLNAYAQINEELLNNARRAVEIMTQEIKYASSVYAPTSVFDTNPGQLSLETTKNKPPQEERTYVDIYQDNGKLYIKREDSDPELVVSENIKVTELTFNHLKPAATKEAVRLKITMAYESPAKEAVSQIPVTLFATVSLPNY